MKIILSVVPAGFVTPKDKSDAMPRVSVAIGFKPDPAALEQPDKASAEIATAIKILGNWPNVLNNLPEKVWELNAGTSGLETQHWSDPSAKYPVPNPELWNLLVWGTGNGLAGAAQATLNQGKSATQDSSVVTWLPHRELSWALNGFSSLKSFHDMNKFQAQFSDKRKAHPITSAEHTEPFGRVAMLQNLSVKKLILGGVEIENEQIDLLEEFTTTARNEEATRAEKAIINRNRRRLSVDGAEDLKTSVTLFLEYFVYTEPKDVQKIYSRGYRDAASFVSRRINPILTQAAAFHQRISATTESSRARLMVNRKGFLDPSREPDIFERIALLRNYPALFRPLGLVVDRVFTEQLPAEGQIKISDSAAQALAEQLGNIPGIEPGSILVLNPSTQFETRSAPATFHAKSRNSKESISGGFLNLDDRDQFAISTADTDGWACKCSLAGLTLAGSDGITVETEIAHPFKITFANPAAQSTLISNLIKKGEELSLLSLINLGPGVEAEDMAYFEEDLLRYSENSDNPNKKLRFDRTRVWESATFTFATKLKIAGKFETASIVATPIRGNDGDLAGIRWQLLDAEPRYNDLEPPKYPVPRSGGVTLLHLDRPQNVFDALKANAESSKNPKFEAEKVLHAEDLVLGYVPDVWLPRPGSSTQGKWLCLTSRSETFAEIEFGNQEAVLRPASAASLDQVDSDAQAIIDDMHVGQALFRWEGEALGVSGNDPAATLQDTQHLESEAEEDSARWKLRTKFAVVPKSQPVLRFSGMIPKEDFNYKLRVRVANIAGNALPLETKDGPSLSFNYRRYEPIAAPPILLDRPPESNDSLQRGLNLMVVTPEGNSDVRWLVPPRVPEQLAELHGMLDVDDLRRAGTFSDCQLDEHGDFPVVSRRNAIPGSLGADPTRDPGECFPIRLPARNRPGFPYYPDPLARGIAYHLEYLSGTGRAFTEPKFLPFYSSSRSWPNAKCVKVILEPTSKSFPYAEGKMATRTLVVRVPHGMSVKLHVNCSVISHATDANNQVKSFELLHHLEGVEEHFQACKTAIASGATEFFAARTTIELVNAAKKPLLEPNLSFGQGMDGNGVIREFNSKIAPVKLEVSADVQSTGKLRFVADWEMPNPNATSDDATMRRHGTDVLGEVQIAEGIAGKGLFLLPRTDSFSHELPDTGYIVVGYRAVGVSRFRNHYPADMGSEEFERAGNRNLARILNSSDPVRPEVAYIVPLYDWSNSAYKDAGVDKFKSTRETALRIYLRGPWNMTGDDEMLGIIVSSASAALKDPDSGKAVDSATRWGLDPLRKFSREISATPERTAFREYCCLAPGEFMDLQKIVRILRGNNSDIRKIRRQLAQETLQRLNGFSGPSDFKLQSLLARDLSKSLGEGNLPQIVTARKRLRELLKLVGEEIFDEKGDFLPLPPQGNSGERWVIPYRPEYDKLKKMWYCDLRIQDVPVDNPFIRFAVSRFQPHSVQGKSLSPPVLLDYVQLAPDRTLTIWRDVKANPENRDVLRVIISGTESNPISQEHEFDVAVHVQLPSGEWKRASGSSIEKKEIIWEKDNTPSSQGVFSGTLSWKKRQGPTRLCVREKLPSNISSPREYQSYPYIDVLEL